MENGGQIKKIVQCKRCNSGMFDGDKCRFCRRGEEKIIYKAIIDGSVVTLDMDNKNDAEYINKMKSQIVLKALELRDKYHD